MRVFRDLSELPSFEHTVVTTGSFDGVHIGHQKILERIANLAETYNAESVVITFDPHPRQVIYPKDDSLRLITSTAEKLRLLEQYGIDNTVVLPFTVEFSQQHAREYVEKFLIERFSPACLVVGYDHRFGLNRKGDYNLLKEYADAGKFNLVKIDKQDIENMTVSSTKVREAVTDGKVDVAHQLLGHPYTIQGTVVHGEKIGKQLGYPTANIRPDSRIKLLPSEGIYAVWVQVDGVMFPGMMYVGRRPTLQSADEQLRIEVNIFDFDGDLYDGQVLIELVSFIRKDQKLDNLEQLRHAISRDEVAVRRALSQGHSDSSAAIVALNYNGIGILEDFMPSFKKYHCGADVIVADNGSTDDSVDYLEREFPDFRLIRMTENTGYAGGYNIALQEVDHEYLALVNTDIELTPGWLQPLIDTLDNDPSVAAVQPKILDAKDRSKYEYAGGCGGYIDALGYPFCAGRILSVVEEDDGQYETESEIFWASGAAFVVRKEVFEALGGFDADYFAHMEEIDLCWRIRRAGFKIKYVPGSTVYHKGGATLPYESARKVFLNFRNNIATLIKNCSAGKLLWVLPMRAILDFLAIMHFFVQGQFKQGWAIVRAHVALLGWLPELVRKRKREKRRIRAISISEPNLAGMHHGSIIWAFYAKGIHTYSQLVKHLNGTSK